MARSSLHLTPEEEHFCFQYCAFVQHQRDYQQHEDLAEAFLAHHQSSDLIDYPDHWFVNEAERNKAALRFFNINKDQPYATKRPRHSSPAQSVLNMANFRRIAYFVAVGFAASMFASYIGVKAAPTTDVAMVTRSAPVEDIFFKGTHFDNTTGQFFDLYVVDDSLSDEAAYESFLSAGDVESTLDKRGWYDCNFGQGHKIKKFCCNTGHQIGTFLRDSGSTATGYYIHTFLSEAFNGKRDNQKPRSICLTKNKNRLCISWATYSAAVATAAEEADIQKYSIQCAESGGSAEFKTETANGGLLYICVSNRPDGCHTSVG